jgi:hypothetical protein
MENQKITTGAPVADNIIIYSPPQPSPRFGAVAEWLAVKSDATGTCMKDLAEVEPRFPVQISHHFMRCELTFYTKLKWGR